jgi:hypothetical protein
VQDEPEKDRHFSSPSESSNFGDEPVATVPIVVPAEEPAERPRKRRKVSEEMAAPQYSTSASSSSLSSRQSPFEVDDKMPSVVEDLPSQNPPTDSLPTFDMPSVFIPDFQRTLTLQGLDQGLIGAEIVDSSKTIPIESLDSESDSPGIISTKTKKRLKELGITEFFAGDLYFTQSFDFFLFITASFSPNGAASIPNSSVTIRSCTLYAI